MDQMSLGFEVGDSQTAYKELLGIFLHQRQTFVAEDHGALCANLLVEFWSALQ